MAIVKMNRFTLLTFERHKQPLLKALQALEKVQFKRLSPDEYTEITAIHRNVENAAQYENELLKVTYAANRLKPFAGLPSGLKAMTAAPVEMTFGELDCFTRSYDYQAVCTAVQDCDERLKALQTELTRLKTENAGLAPWINLDIAPSALERLKTVRHTIGAVNKRTAQDFVAQIETAFPHAYLETLHTVKDDVLYFITAPEAEWDELSAALKTAAFTRAPVSFTALPSALIDENNRRATALKADMEKLNKELQSYAPHYAKLKITADFLIAALERARACENFLNLADVLIIEGWSPQEDAALLKRALDSACPNEYYLEETPVETDAADVPIALKNNKVVSAFEGVTVMFSLPHYNEIDPTPLLTPFYWLFFGIMVGDMGYGVVLLIGTALALKFMHFNKGMRQFIHFFHYLSYAIIFAGILFGGAFGFPVFTPLTAPDGSPKAILDPQLDITIMLVLSIAVGVVQVFFGVGVKGYMLIRDGKVLDAIFDSLFWLITLASGIALLLVAAGFLPASLMTLTKWGFFGGLVALVATSGRSSPSVAGKIANGIYNVYGMTGYISDLISYTRLVALSLSGAYIAYSFNLMAGMIPFLPARIVFGGAIFLFGQSLNMGLSLLGSYVHSCRLQFVEFFGKFYEGGGVPFKPLSPRNIFIKIKN